MTADTIVRVDPKTLHVGSNVRRDVDLNPEFVGTIREGGVRIPIVAYEDGDGNLVVVDGQRRTLAAVDTGQKDVPVYVAATPSEAERIIDQMLANEQRDALTEKDAAQAVHELTLFEFTVPAIATKLGLEPAFVEQAVAVGKSKAAQKVMTKYPHLDIDDLAILAEFDAHPKQQAELMKIAESGGYWVGAATRMREERQLAEVSEQIKNDAGLTLIKDPGWNASDPRPVNELYLDAKRTKCLADEPHEKVVELAGDGLCAWPGTGWSDGKHGVIVKYAVKGWKARGLFAHESSRPAQATTPEDAEKLKTERREARENTKAWVAESVARVTWLQQLVQRKTLPKGWEPLVARRLIENGGYSTSQLRFALTILQLKEATDEWSIRSNISKHLDAHPPTTSQTMIAIALGSIEGSFEFERKGWSQEKTPAYLALLGSWGYPLGELEQKLAAKASKGKKAA